MNISWEQKFYLVSKNIPFKSSLNAVFDAMFNGENIDYLYQFINKIQF